MTHSKEFDTLKELDDIDPPYLRDGDEPLNSYLSNRNEGESFDDFNKRYAQEELGKIDKDLDFESDFDGPSGAFSQQGGIADSFVAEHNAKQQNTPQADGNSFDQLKNDGPELG